MIKKPPYFSNSKKKKVIQYDKIEERKIIETETKVFLANGGKIKTMRDLKQDE